MTKEEKIKEAFIPILNYENIYEINEFGQVKSLCRNTTQKNGKNYLVKEKIMKPQIDNTGYVVFGLRSNNKTTKVYLHRILCEAFIPNPDNKPCVNHKNGVKHDNSLSNLEWCTYQENNSHAFETGLQKKGSQHHLYGKKGMDCHNHKYYNRGWIKIESEIDYPKEEIDCHFIFLKNNSKYQTFGVFDKKLNSFWSGSIRITNITHYQPIIKPQPPIY